MMQPIRTLAAISFLAVWCICGSASGTTLKRMSVGEMSRAAQAIVRARCVSSTARWDVGEIWTFTTLDVEETWKGTAPARITVRLLGGNVGTLTSTVSGIPHFAPGEQLVLFLERTPAGDFSIVSWVQGTFRIGLRGTAGEETVTQDTAAFAVLDPVSHRFEASGIRKMPAEAFRALVAASLEGKPGRTP